MPRRAAIPSPAFAERLNRLMAARDLRQKDVADAVGAYSGDVGRWRSGGGISIQGVRALASFFGEPRAEWEQLAGYGDSEPDAPVEPVRLSPDEVELLGVYRAKPENKPTVLRTVYAINAVQPANGQPPRRGTAKAGRRKFDMPQSPPSVDPNARSGEHHPAVARPRERGVPVTLLAAWRQHEAVQALASDAA